MSQPLRFGVLVLPNTDYPEQVRRWQHVEALGFDSLWDCDHFVNPFQPDQTWFEGRIGPTGIGAHRKLRERVKSSGAKS